MLIKSSDKHGYRLLTIEQDTFTAEHVEELQSLISENLRNKVLRIALSLTPATYPYSQIISLLVKCTRQIEEAGGSLVVVQPNRMFHDVCRKLNLDAVLKIVLSEEDLV